MFSKVLVNFPILNICKWNWEFGYGSSFFGIKIWILVLEWVSKIKPNFDSVFKNQGWDNRKNQ
jgi:hypothetical protein